MTEEKNQFYLSYLALFSLQAKTMDIKSSSLELDENQTENQQNNLDSELKRFIRRSKGLAINQQHMNHGICVSDIEVDF